MPWFLADVGQFGHRGLHAEGEFILSDARRDFRIAGRFVSELIEAGDVVQNAAARFGADAFGVGQIQDRIADRAKLHALILRRQEPAAPEAVVERLVGGIAGAL